MIGWKCKYGYFKTAPSGQFDISTIEFLDDGAITFGTGMDISKVPNYINGVTGTGVDVPSPEIGYNLFKSIFGKYTGTLYGIGGNVDYRVEANLVIPGIYSQCPNLLNYLIGKNTRVATYIPTLNLIIYTAAGVPTESSYYVGDNEGKIFTRTINSRQNFTFNGLEQSFSYFCLKEYSGLDSLKNPDNHIYFFCYINSGEARSVQFHSLTRAENVAIANLFTKEPDFVDNFPPVNPYEPGGPSGEGGGGGSFDDDSDIIGIPDLPTLSAANTGFTRIYNPTLSQVQDLARYLWTDETVVQTIWNHIKQFFENPMEAIIGFNLVPVPVPDGGTQNFALMYIDTGVQMTVAANQFVDVDCGTLEIKQYFGSALDYAPYTKISCYLPYIGVVTLNTDEVMGRTLQVVYRVDICSGSCVAYITVDGNAIYQYSGHCAINIPISAADFSSYVNAAISVGKLAGTLALGASGIAGAAAVSEVTQTTGETTSRVVNTERNAATGRQITTGTQTVTKGPQEITTTKASYSGIPPANITNTAGEVISSKPHVEHSGSFSGNSGYLGVRRPFVIIQRPNMCMPENYQTLNGFPSMITMKLSECTGFTRIQQVQLTNMGQATNPEQAEIQQLLKMGVIF